MTPVRSPRVPAVAIARYPAATRPPRPHTDVEIGRLMQMLGAVHAQHIAIGHGRHPTSIAAADSLAAVWTDAGNTATTISWPPEAASWLRPARRLIEQYPDAWVIADTPAGTVQVATRLAEHDSWSPASTFGFASVASPDLISLTGPLLVGMRGATADGDRWRVHAYDIITTSEHRPAANR